MTTIGWTATFVTGAWLAASLPASAAGVEVTNYEVTKEFEGAHATDLSGIACVPLNQGEYRCLVIDDESKFAQLAKIEDSAIEAKAKIQLIKKEEPVGKKPSVACANGMGVARLGGGGAHRTTRRSATPEPKHPTLNECLLGEPQLPQLR